MKINEVIIEANILDKVGSAVGKTVGGVAKGMGAVAGGIAGIPSAAKKGFQAGKATVSGEPVQTPAAGSVVQQAPGYTPGPIEPRTGAQQYVQDIGSAIRAGAAGDISAKKASPTDAEKARAPVGTKVGQWTKTVNGWVDSKTNKAATPVQTATLDKKWYTATQKQLRQQGAIPQQSAAGKQALIWDAKKKILTVNGQPYKKTAKGWQDIATDELVDPKYAGELQTAFDIASGRVPVKTGSSDEEMVQSVGTVTTPRGIKATKWSDGKWTTPDEEGKHGYVLDSDVPHLEQLLKKERPHTGGKRPGVLSPTPGAIKQRQARAAKKQPTVFTSNRPAK